MFSPLFVQFNPRVGDLEGNRQRLASLLCSADEFPLALVPELALTGYPPRDLLELDGFVARAQAELSQLAVDVRACGPVLIGSVATTPEAPGLYNAAWLLQGGQARMLGAKQLLPDYDVFDEPRHFAVGSPCEPLMIQGQRVGVTICEDLWGGADVGQSDRYAHVPAANLAQSCDLLVNLSASPYQRGKPAQRLAQASALARQADCAVAVVNAVGGNDELIFDGHSFWTDGSQAFALPGFEELACRATAVPVFGEPLDMDREALVLGLRDYVRKCGGSRVVLGLSGGIDSALVCSLAVEALGADHVTGLAMPSCFSSTRSVADARELARRLGCPLHEVSIEAAHDLLRGVLGSVVAVEGVTDENLQARLRGMLVMAVANSSGAFALATGNKSELAVGYCTLYGDMCGAIAPIGDLWKMDVFRMAQRDKAIPDTTVHAAPSAELRADQKDEDSLPPYVELDAILDGLVVGHHAPEHLVAQGHDKDVVQRVVVLLDRNEFKRRQAAPVLRVSRKALGMGRRYPLAWRRGF